MIRYHQRPSVIDLFCGAGGFSLGFQAAGSDIIAAVDADETAARTYAANLGRLQPHAQPLVISGEQGNLEDLDLEWLVARRRADILIGGPPCQGFSAIGRAKLDSLSDRGHAADPRNELYRRFLCAAELWRPLAVVMENVPGMLSTGGRNIAADAAVDLANRGYRVGYGVLNAVWYGVPQYRERLFFIGIREDLEQSPSVPPATHFASLPSGYQKPLAVRTAPLSFIHHSELAVDTTNCAMAATTSWDALDDLPPLTYHLSDPLGDSNVCPALTEYPCVPHSRYAQLMRLWPGLPAINVVRDHVIRRTPRDYETFKRMQPGDRYPAALAIARARFQEELDHFGSIGSAPAPGTPEYTSLERRFVPPYPEEMFVDKWRKLIPGRPSWTVPAHLSKDAYSHIHYDSDQARAISIREAARLQSFPDAFTFSGNVGERYRQVGNAVPPLLAWAVASRVLESLGFEARRLPWSRAEAYLSYQLKT